MEHGESGTTSGYNMDADVRKQLLWARVAGEYIHKAKNTARLEGDLMRDIGSLLIGRTPWGRIFITWTDQDQLTESPLPSGMLSHLDH